MRWTNWMALSFLAGAATVAQAQAPAEAPATAPPTTLAPPPTVQGYVVTLEINALAPEIKAPKKQAPEAEALMGKLRQQAQLVSKVYLAQDLSRQEIVSTDFILPAGTLVMHKAGDRYYAIADPKAQTFVVMDAETLLNALEGGAGVLNTQYDAKVVSTTEKKTIAGLPCRKSIVTVTYVSTVPFENSTVMVQQKNDIEIWHTPQLVSTAAMDHFFFKFQRDKTGTVQKLLAQDIGFPMEVSFVVTQGAPGAKKKPASAQPGSFHFAVTDVKVDKKLDSELFRIPPAGYKKVEKNPYFKEGGLSSAGAEMAGEKPQAPKP